MRVFGHDDGIPAKGNAASGDYRRFEGDENMSWGSVIFGPGQTTTYHSHGKQAEVYIVQNGQGIVVDGSGIIQPIHEGQSAYFDPGELHAIGCPQDGEILDFRFVVAPPIEQSDVEKVDFPDIYGRLLGLSEAE